MNTVSLNYNWRAQALCAVLPATCTVPMVSKLSTTVDRTLPWVAAITAARADGLGPRELGASESKYAIMARSGIGVLLYMLVVAGTVFLSILEIGITNSILLEVYPERGSGLWEAEPEWAIAGATVYFLLIGLAEITLFRSSSRAMIDQPNQ